MNKAVFLGAVLLLLSSAIRAETIILNLEEPKLLVQFFFLNADHQLQIILD